MSSWADESEDQYSNERPLEQAPAEYTGGGAGGGVRPRLQLKPRSTNAGSASYPSSSSTSTSKSNPFGAAKPREEGATIAYYGVTVVK